MVDKLSAPAAGAATATDGSVPEVPPTPTPTVTFHQQLAADFMKELDDVARLIPKIEIALVSSPSFVQAFRGLPVVFLGTAITSVEQTPELQNVNKLDVAAGRDTLQFLEAFRPVLDKITALRKSVQFAMDSRKATLAAPALQIYDLANGLARYSENTALASVIANMKRDLGRRGKVPSSARKGAKPATVVPPKEGGAAS